MSFVYFTFHLMILDMQSNKKMSQSHDLRLSEMSRSQMFLSCGLPGDLSNCKQKERIRINYCMIRGYGLQFFLWNRTILLCLGGYCMAPITLPKVAEKILKYLDRPEEHPTGISLSCQIHQCVQEKQTDSTILILSKAGTSPRGRGGSCGGNIIVALQVAPPIFYWQLSFSLISQILRAVQFSTFFWGNPLSIKYSKIEPAIK